jgi:hypothetical protein
MGPLVMYLTLMKLLWNPHVGNLKKNIMGMGMHIIIEQMGKVDPKNRANIIILEKWMTVIPN